MTQERDPDVLAGEYVLGLLDGAVLQSFERRLDDNPALSAAVQRWRSRLAPIDATAKQFDPPAEMWRRIESGLDPVIAARPHAAAPTPSVNRLRQWWESLWLWRSAALAGAAAAIVLAVSLGAAVERARRQPVMVAVLLTDSNVAAAVVNTFADGRVELLPLQDIAVPEGRALQIWTLWDRAAGPRSVGLVDRARTVALRLDNLPLGANQLFEITVEPASGSPTGRPTGPIVAKGLTARSL